MANRSRLDEVEAQRPGAYQKGQSVLDAEQAVRDQQALRPGDYESRWDTNIEEALGKLTDRPKFQYDFNADPLYQMYRQQYTQLGKQAAANAAAESAALTGGFGNSYATSAAAQANQNYLNMLNGIIPDLYDRAADRYDAEGAELWRQFGAFQDLDATDYERYRDRYGDWEWYLDYLTGRADTEYNRDYGQYTDSYQQWQDWLNYWSNDYNSQGAQDQWAAELAEQQRQFNEQMAFSQAQFEYQQAQDAAAAAAAAAAQAASASRISSGGSGSSGSSTSKSSSSKSSTSSSGSQQTFVPWSNEVYKKAQGLREMGLNDDQIADWLNRYGVRDQLPDDIRAEQERLKKEAQQSFFQTKYPWQL